MAVVLNDEADRKPHEPKKLGRETMVASATMFVVNSSRSTLIREEPPVGGLAMPDRLPSWATEQSEFDLLERSCLSEDALWSRLGNWDL